MVKFPKLRILGGIAVPKVLLADDSTHAQRMGTKILTGEGFEVVTVSNGEAAVKKLTGGGFDLVLADVFMPGRTGYELCAFVKTDPKTSYLPVILVVGQLEPYDPAQGDRVQADGVLTKPFEASKVLAMVKGALKVAEQKKKAAAPPPPPPPLPEEAAPPAPESAMPEMELEAAHPTPVEVPEDLAQGAFGMFAEEAAPPEPPAVEAFEVAPAPEAAAPFAFEEAAPAAAEFAFPAEPVVEAPAVLETKAEELEVELTPEPAEAAEPPAAVVPEIETQAAAPAGFELTTEAPSTEFELPVEPAATAELILEEPARAAEEAPAAPPALHWAAEPAEVTEADRALFGPPAAMAGAAAAPAAAPAPEGAPDWGDLLKHVEEPVEATAAAAPAPAAEAAAEAPAAAVAEAVVAIPAEPAPAVQAAPIPEEAIAVEQPPLAGQPATEAVAVEAVAPPLEPAPEAVPAQEPVPAETAAPPQARVALDPEMVRAAVEGGFDQAGMTALKAVPGLVDAIVSEILRRMN
jgi:CheY-like chemotaxis protein